jgi:hypothetical protein
VPKKSKGFFPYLASHAEVSSFPHRRQEEVATPAVPETAAAVNDQREFYWSYGQKQRENRFFGIH